MLSSTSSSSARLPAGPWPRIWVAAGLVVFLAIGALEGFWRARGHEPSVTDDAALWMLARHAVPRNDPAAVVVIGASRVQQGLALDVFARHWGNVRPVQLAIGGATAVPVLDHLSRDSSFRGLVLADVVPFLFYPGGFSTTRGPAAEYVADYVRTVEHGPVFNSGLLERRLRAIVQRRSVVRTPALSPSLEHVKGWLERGSLPEPTHRVMTVHRDQRADYRQLDPATLERTKQLWVDRIRALGYGPAADEFVRELKSLEAMVDRIQQRGGRVVFLALPVSGVVREMEESRQPRAKYWDVLARYTSALSVHFADHPELAGIECLEGSHLDYRDAGRYTEGLVAVLRRLGVEPGGRRR